MVRIGDGDGGRAARGLDLPYALSWWACTFPLGSLAVATGVAWKVSGFESIHWFSVAAVVALFGAWIAVAVRASRAIWVGKVFESPYQPGPKRRRYR